MTQHHDSCSPLKRPDSLSPLKKVKVARKMPYMDNLKLDPSSSSKLKEIKGKLNLNADSNRSDDEEVSPVQIIKQRVQPPPASNSEDQCFFKLRKTSLTTGI